MKKVTLLFLLLCSISGVYSQNNCNTFGTGDICQNFKNNNQTQRYQACCACGSSPQRTNTTGCPASVPLNTGLIYLLVAGFGVGGYTLVRQRSAITQ